jgi:hypothetical protein
MNTAEHSVAAEDVMAFVDGELSPSEALAVSEHMKHCESCSALAEELRSTSEMLSQWSVPAVPRTVADSVGSRRAEAGRKNKAGQVYGGALRGWKLFGFGGGVVAAVLMGVIFLSLSRREVHAPSMQTMVSGYAERPVLPEMQSTAKARAGDFSMAISKPPAPGPPPSLNGPVGGMVADVPAPMIVQTNSLVVRVKNVDAARSSLDSILARHHGYSARLNAMTPEGGPRNFLASLRIPAGDFTAAVGEIKGLGRVEIETQSGEEVSQRHADLVARLKTARETEERFRAILAERTGRISDVLEVEQSIARLRGEIEGMEAEQKALEHRVDFVTVELQLTEEYKAQLNPGADSVSVRLHNSLVAGYHNAKETLLVFVLFFEEYGPSLAILLIILGLPVVLMWRRYKRIRPRL